MVEAMEVKRQSPAGLRQRIGVELGILAVLTPLFLYYAPHDAELYAALALAFFAIVAINLRNTHEHVWAPHALDRSAGLRRSARVMTLLTLPAAAVFFGWWLWNGHTVSYLNLALAFCLYVPWALLQQAIFQLYLLGRLRVVLPGAPAPMLALLNGSAYGLVHLPNPGLALLTVVAGSIWSYAYLRDRKLLPIALSHALLGSTFYYFVDARDLLAELLARFALH